MLWKAFNKEYGSKLRNELSVLLNTVLTLARVKSDMVRQVRFNASRDRL
jgi:hypothetical protein